jgi:pre-mRNA-processing factor 6
MVSVVAIFCGKLSPAVKAMEAQQVVIERDAWFRESESAEKGQSVATAQAIVRATLGLGVDEQDRRNTWLQDAEMVWFAHSMI